MNNAELETKINRAIDVLRSNEPTGGYGLAFSGDEWFEDYIANAGRMKVQETCQMELMFVGGFEDER